MIKKKNTMMPKLKTLSYLFIISLILILTGCEKEFNDQSSDIKKLSDAGISKSFDWSTTKDINITVKVDDQYEGKYYYTVDVFDSNPIIDIYATPISSGSAKQSQDYKATVTIPKTDTDAETVSYLYIRQTSPSKSQVVKMAEISGDNISVNFGTETSVVSAKSITKSSSFETKSFGESSEINDSGITNAYPTPAGLTEITADSHTLTAGTNYVISAGVTYSGTITFPATGSSSLYIEGTWKNTTSSGNIKGSTIIIQNGGKITSTVTSTFSMDKSSLLFIANGGTFEGNNISISYSYKPFESKIVNYGEMECSAISGLMGLYNYGILTIDGNLTAQYTVAKILNKGTLTINGDVTMHGVFQNTKINTTTITGKFTADGSDGVTIINNGFLEINDLTIQSTTLHNNGRLIIDNDFTTVSNTATINIASGALIKTTNYIAASTSAITMDGNAILEVTNKMTVNAKSTITGTASGTEYALARLNSVEASDEWHNLKCSGNVEIENSIYGDKDIICNENVKLAEEGSSDVTIEATDYNQKGNTVKSGTPAEKTFPIIESSTKVYTYLFEDCWPDLGDYDMNDLVLDIKDITYGKNADNSIKSMTLTAVLRADGGSFKLGGAIQLDGVESDKINSVSSNFDLTDYAFNTTNGIESGQTYAVIPLFNEAHAAMGATQNTMTNTRTDGKGETVASKTINLTINFKDNSNVSSSDVSLKKLNVFIIVNYGDGTTYTDGKIRKEIHLAGYAPTDLGTYSLFGTGDDNSNESDVSSLYKSKTNLTWGLAVPGSLRYPLEYEAITKAYPKFKDWATSGGASNADWHVTTDSNYIY